jgi:GT2 family glycosyltransferase
MNLRLSASIVLYNTCLTDFELVVSSFLNGVTEGLLVISDNSDQILLHPLLKNARIKYIFNNENLGFAAAHNRAISMISEISDIHLILNPDISFNSDVLPHLIGVMENHAEIGALMPKILYPDGSLQRLCKLLPTPLDLILRRFLPIKFIKNRINERYELYHLPQDVLSDVPTISGCFMMLRTELLVEIGGFDEQYFMYLEDVDLARRIGTHSRVVYDPRVFVIHNYAKGSYSNKKLMVYHIKSAWLYFMKWGWWFDFERRRRNKIAKPTQ